MFAFEHLSCFSDYSVRHFLGHFSTHAPHLTQASDTSQTLSALFTVRASQGQTLAQSPQNTHTSLSHLSLSLIHI